MTGFGKAAGQFEGCGFAIELNSVNRRNLETSFSLPRDWQFLERPFAENIRKHIKRGKIHVSLRLDSAQSQSPVLSWDAVALNKSLESLQAQALAAGAAWQPDASLLLQLAMLHRCDGSQTDTEALERMVMPVFEQAVQSLESMRCTEGNALATDLLQRVQAIENACAQIAVLSADLVELQRQALMQRLRTAGIELNLDDERLLKELAFFADKSDIAEELTRLQSHIEQIKGVIDSQEELQGRKLEFILQEIHREVNTIGSKSVRVEVTRLVIDCKNEIERIREQVQNIE
ncbi:MAG: YicC family protein [Verrucomicrobia bacterium]|nr:YicC family protein [Verrucomicrobiota bacterium]